MTEAAPAQGQVFAGRYRLATRIGSGGFGAVYEATHVVTERRVAIKLLWPHFAKDLEFRKRFLREARLATQIGSEFIVDVLDAGVEESTDTPFLVMELLRGESIAARISRKKTFSPDDTAIYLSQVAAALDRTHARGVVHRDLKPANLFLTQRSDGSPLVKILDFGIAKLLASTAMEAASHTLGTPLFMAPEQFNNSTVTPACDIYALGMIAFRFLVGSHYFALEQRQCENVYLFASVIGQGPTEPARVRAERYGAELPEAFDAWFARACHREASERFASATDAVFALADAIGVAVAAPLVARPSRLKGALTHGVDSIPDYIKRSVDRAQVAAPFGGTVPLIVSDQQPGRVTALSPTAPPPESERRPVSMDMLPTLADDEAPTVGSAIARTMVERLSTSPISLTTLAPETVTDSPALVPSASAPPKSHFLAMTIAAVTAAIVVAVIAVGIFLFTNQQKSVEPAAATSAETPPAVPETAAATLATPGVTPSQLPVAPVPAKASPTSQPSSKKAAEAAPKTPTKPTGTAAPTTTAEIYTRE